MYGNRCVSRKQYRSLDFLKPVSGAKCGSTAIDRNFYLLLSKRFGHAFDSLPLKKKGPGSNLMKAFEQVKRDFGYLSEDQIHELPLNMFIEKPDPEYFDVDERLVLLTR